MKKNNILIFGKGFIGTRLAEALGACISEKFIFTLQDALDEISQKKPDIIINCVGFIGRNVDECEIDKDTTLQANTFVPILLAEAAVRTGVMMVQISSGCIYHYDYDKNIPLTEDKAPDYFNLFYSRSKIYSERALEVLCRTYPLLIARIRVPLDDRPNPRNLLNKLIAYRKVIDTPNSVTYIPDFILALKHLLTVEARGIYNLVNKNALRYPALMETYKRYVPGFNYEVVNFKSLGLERTNLVLSVAKLEKTGFKIRGIDEVLEECVQNYLKY